MRVVGVDGCPKGWIAIVLEDGAFARAIFSRKLVDLVDAEPDAKVMAIDVPIGSEPDRFRRVDASAWQFVGPRWQNIREVPPLEVMQAPRLEEALAICEALTKKSFSNHGYALRDKVLEVAAIVKPDDHIIEAHPEVSFRALQGSPLLTKKSTWAGHTMRRDLLEGAGIVLPSDLADAGLNAAPSDVLDAAAVAWTANRHATGASQRLKPVIRDATGRLVTSWL
jgi:predicted RNase H-like nuclease